MKPGNPCIQEAKSSTSAPQASAWYKGERNSRMEAGKGIQNHFACCFGPQNPLFRTLHTHGPIPAPRIFCPRAPPQPWIGAWNSDPNFKAASQNVGILSDTLILSNLNQLRWDLQNAGFRGSHIHKASKHYDGFIFSMILSLTLIEFYCISKYPHVVV